MAFFFSKFNWLVTAAHGRPLVGAIQVHYAIQMGLLAWYNYTCLFEFLKHSAKSYKYVAQNNEERHKLSDVITI